VGNFEYPYTLTKPKLPCLTADTDITTASTYTDPCNHSNEAIMFTWIKRLIVTSTLLALIVSKNATIKKQKATSIKRKAATRRFGSRLTSRTKRVAAKSIAAIPTESIPFLGVAV
jgi:hypothetical protein